LVVVVSSLLIRTIVPIIFLIGAGFLSRRLRLLKEGDERVLSAYVYYFALPALFLINMATTNFTPEILAFMSAGVTPNLLAICIYRILQIFIRFSRGTLYLLTLSTIFGSTAFFGIPFLTFAFPSMEKIVTLSAVLISIVSVPITLTFLEFYKLQESTKINKVKQVAKRLIKNPLIISIFIGVSLSILNIEIPAPIADSVHMLGSTTSTVAIFMLGVFLYGRTYSETGAALKLGLLRALFLPMLALLTTKLLGVTSIEASILILMNGMPLAISMIILSERYDFYKETMATLILVSSFGATIYQNLWRLLLGHY
jgi:malonate transporter